MNKPNKPMTMIYAEAKANFYMAVRNIAQAHGLPLFLTAEITADIAADFKKEAMNEHAADVERYEQELTEYYEESLREATATPQPAEKEQPTE